MNADKFQKEDRAQEKQIRALMIGAHPDDCEFKTGGLAARYRAEGHLVKFERQALQPSASA